jgi:hypothetical protein
VCVGEVVNEEDIEWEVLREGVEKINFIIDGKEGKER